MSHTKILLLDLDASCRLGGILRSILESFYQESLKLRYERVGVDRIVSHNDTFSAFKSDIIFLVLSAEVLKQTTLLFQSLRRESFEIPILAVAEASTPDEMFSLLQLGADDFITPPLTAIDIFPRIWRFLGRYRKDTLTHILKRKLGLRQLIGQSRVFLDEIDKIPLVAKCDASVLISGETGTGKELFARAIHYLSLRADKPFVPVNCGAVPSELVENELFGHEKGAFTGASEMQLGLIREADGGTLFLDEVDCLPLLAQVKLLRFLQEKEYRPLGSTKVCPADVRIIAATNINVGEAVTSGGFRQDLYYRLNVVPLTLPPLRERREDILLLAHHFLTKYATKLNNKHVTGFSPDAVQILLMYEWPGNVRELEHVIERALVLSTHEVIRSSDIVLPDSRVSTHVDSFRTMKSKLIVKFERTYIQGLLSAYRGNITKAAQAAHKNRRAFWQLIHKHGIDVESFRSTVL